MISFAVHTRLKALSLLFVGLMLMPTKKVFAVAELSATGSLSKSSYGGRATSKSMRYTFSMGIDILEMTQIEGFFTKSRVDYDNAPIQTTHTEERNFGVNIVQSLFPKRWVIQPYVKAGAARYKRRQTGTYMEETIEPTQDAGLSGVLGAGLRIYIFRFISLKGDYTVYLPEFHIAEAKNNYAIQLGLGVHF